MSNNKALFLIAAAATSLALAACPAGDDTGADDACNACDACDACNACNACDACDACNACW